jgi:hypothetical protein
MMGSISHLGSGLSSSAFLVRSDGQVCRRRLESCFHRGFGAASIWQCQLSMSPEGYHYIPCLVAPVLRLG